MTFADQSYLAEEQEESMILRIVLLTGGHQDGGFGNK